MKFEDFAGEPDLYTEGHLHYKCINPPLSLYKPKQR